MSQTAEQLLAAAMGLSDSERVALASALWESVEEEPACSLSPQWRTEILRRKGESDRGEGVSLSEEEVEQRLKDRYGPLPD
jgi:putative addiction module component (TIGR02574 family)